MPLKTGSPRGPTLRSQRLRLTWLLAFPFLYLSRPSAGVLLAGALISLSGLCLRARAAGFILKDRELARGGPYGRLRHPLYLGTFLIGAGFSVAGGIWWFLVGYAGLFVWMSRRTIRAEEAYLVRRFGEDYESYRDRVPSLVPRFGRHSGGTHPQYFRCRLYRRNKEWQAALGTLIGYLLLWARMSWPV